MRAVESDKSETIDNPLHDAAKRGNTAFLQECIANNVSVNSLDKVDMLCEEHHNPSLT
jgi:hypothetical protein